MSGLKTITKQKVVDISEPKTHRKNMFLDFVDAAASPLRETPDVSISHAL